MNQTPIGLSPSVATPFVDAESHQETGLDTNPVEISNEDSNGPTERPRSRSAILAELERRSLLSQHEQDLGDKGDSRLH